MASQPTLRQKLAQAQTENRSWLCIGLDPVRDRLPASVRDIARPFLAFCRAIVAATADLVCAYKPNLAFWLAEGPAGLAQLQALIADIPPTIPVILDGKFNDVGHTANAYAHFAFEVLGVDAVTLNPYLGMDGIRPFLNNENFGAFLLARTSNPSAPDVQDLSAGGNPVYEEIARLAAQWEEHLPGMCGLVVGATYPAEMARVRQLAPTLPFLIPGVGAQGGSVEAARIHGPTQDELGPVVNSSRGIIYASSGDDFAQAARNAALRIQAQLRPK